MDGNLHPMRWPAMPDPGKEKEEEIQTRSDTSGITGVNSKDVVEHEEIASPGLPIAGSMSTEWTDEKHSLYLNFMETSFVRKLYNHEYCSSGFLGWGPKKKSRMDPSSSQLSNAKVSVTSDQFKVLQSGCWRKHKFENAQPLSEGEDESYISVNPWIQHFKDGRKHQLASPNVQTYGAPCTEATSFGCQSTKSEKLMASSSHQDSGFDFQEVCDQNFVNEEKEGKQSSSLCRTKRTKTVASDVSDNDQVVPLGKSSSTSEECASPEKKRSYTDGGDVT